jgi:hypothetical protein
MDIGEKGCIWEDIMGEGTLKAGRKLRQFYFWVEAQDGQGSPGSPQPGKN